MVVAAVMFGSANNSPQPADNESKDTYASPACDASTASSNLCDDSGGNEPAASAARTCIGADLTVSGDGRSFESPDRTAVEKIHLLPVSEEAPKGWVFAALTGFMKDCKTVRQYMYVRVKCPSKDSKSTRKASNTDTDSRKATDTEYTYIVVACLPHSGVITPSTIVFTSGSPLKPLRRVQLLALVHPNSSYARRAGVASYSQALQRGLVGEASASGRSSRNNNSSSRREGGATQADQATTGCPGSNDWGAVGGTDGAADHRRHLGSAFNWGDSLQDVEGQRRRHRRVREYNSAEAVIAAVLDDSGPESDGEGGEEDDAMGGATAFRLSDAEARDNGGTEWESPGGDPPLQPQRTLQRNFNFPSSSSSTLGPPGDASGGIDDLENVGIRSFSERVLFYDFVAPYFRARSASGPSPTSPSGLGPDAASKDTAVVVFPGKKLVIKDLTFVVWATDPDNAPGFLRKDTAVYISVDPWGEYRRVHILPFADTLPTTYSFRLFEDYLQPFLKEQPWRLIRKGDIFSFRGVEFKVIATEPSSVPVARVGPETMVHFEGTLNPSLIDILPPEVLSRVRRLPARVQPFAIIAAAQTLDPQLLLRVLPTGNMRGNQRGIDEGLEAAVERQLVRPFCLSQYQNQHADLCTRRPRGTAYERRHDHEADDECTARQAGSAPPGASSSTPEATAAVAEAETDDWELDAPCCTVCTLQLQDGAETLTLACGHAFHWGCAKAWLRCSATCPNCRAEVVLPSEGGGSAAGSAATVGTAALGFVRNVWADFFST